MKFKLQGLQRIVVGGGVGIALLAGIGATAARADRVDDLRNDVRHDLDVISRDKQRISDMQYKRRIQLDKRNFKHARMTADDIENARLYLRRDQEKLRRDQRELARFDRRGRGDRWRDRD